MSLAGIAGAALVRARFAGGTHVLLRRDGRFFDIRPLTLDTLLRFAVPEIRAILSSTEFREMTPNYAEILAPVESQEVWAAGVTYLRSREARLEEATEKTIYEHVYESDRPELFFKAAGWRVVRDGGEIGVRQDSTWDVPEPELAVLMNAHAEVVAYSCGNDMSSRSIEGENPLFLPQAKIYDRSCAIGPGAVVAWDVDVSRATITMTIDRDGEGVFSGRASVADMTREPADLVRVLASSYTLPHGAWLLTGTSLVPPLPYTAKPGDRIRIGIEGLGELVNTVSLVPHSGAEARPTRLSQA